ncbi:MAG TPA: dTMP kinase [Acidimicrobiales bacterium]
MTARWVAFEGGEGSGKSTQARLFAERVGAVLSREPGGTAIGERIRAVLLDPSTVGLSARAETLLMAADRAQHVDEVVRPALASGRTVVSDRSAYSSLAYQGFGRGLGVDDVRQVSSWASGDVWPDVVVLLDVDDAVRASRMNRAHDRMESAGADFHARVHAGFRELAAADPDRGLVVDGAGPVESVEAAVRAAFEAWEAGGG